jgi:LPXTG-motif cell wall-anchored protein
MSATRRILAAGLPAAAALLFAASPALAMGDHAARPAATASACPAGGRDNCDYGATGAGGYGNAGAETPGTETPGAGAPGTAATPTGGHTRGQNGYKPTTPATVPTTPSAHVDTVPPTATPSTTIQGATPTPSQSTGGGVSAGHALPVTGAPMSAIISLGALMVAGGAASVWYSRRRRSV